MEDLLLSNTCNHVIYDEELDLLPITGTSQYYADFKYQASGDIVRVREWNETEGLTLFNWVTDGVTDFTATSSRITFNTGYPILAGFRHADGATLNYPQNQYLATYTVPLASCPKCYGDKTVHDIAFDNVGKLRVIDGKNKVSQLLIKALLTEKGKNSDHPEYGSILATMVGKKMTAFTIVQLQQSIQSCISQLMSYQAGYIDDLPADEIILGISNMTIEPDSNDSRILNIIIYVTTGVYETIRTNLQLTL